MNNTTTINHRELLKLFMAHMIDMEGSDYLGYHMERGLPGNEIRVSQ